MNEKEQKFISVKDLNVIYTSGKKVVHAVNGISFDIRRGETLALVGETGAGKTTVANTIMRILPDPPARVMGGEVILEGCDLLKISEKEMLKVRGNKISMIFQDPMTALNPTMRVGEQIAEGIRLHNKVSKAESVERAKQMLEMVGIPAERFREYPHQFSGGMKQRVIIAIALACNPELLLADEPTTALDVTIQAQILEMINALKTKMNTAMLLITHDLGVVAKYCDNVAIVYAGEIIESGTKAHIFENAAHPYTKGLFGALPKIDEDVDRLTPVEGTIPDPANLPEGCHFWPRCPYATESCKENVVGLFEIEPGHFCRCMKEKKEGTENG